MLFATICSDCLFNIFLRRTMTSHHPTTAALSASSAPCSCCTRCRSVACANPRGRQRRWLVWVVMTCSGCFKEPFVVVTTAKTMIRRRLGRRLGKVGIQNGQLSADHTLQTRLLVILLLPFSFPHLVVQDHVRDALHAKPKP